MFRLRYLLSAAALLLGFGFVVSADEAIPGEADYKLNVQDFSELVVDNDLSVDYFCSPDSAGWAVFTCLPQKAEMIMFNNNKSCLRIQLDTESKNVGDMPKIKVYSSTLSKVVNSGDSIVRVFSPAAVTQLKSHLIGNGILELFDVHVSNMEAGITTGKCTIRISGKAQKAKLHNVGTGLIDAKGLVASQVKCILMGGHIECNAGDNLTISGAGGNVKYHGTPKKLSNRSLGAKLEKVE